MGEEALEKWYLDGAVLRPTPKYLREHVTALSKFHDAATLVCRFSDDRTVTFTHAQLSASPLEHLGEFAHMTVRAPSEGFDIIRRFIYCTPVDLSVIPCGLVEASWGWQLYELHMACFFVAETVQLGIVELVKKYIPLLKYGKVPVRFKCYLAGRIAIDGAQLLDWLGPVTKRKDRDSNRYRFQRALRDCDMTERVGKAMRLYSDLNETDILGGGDGFEYSVYKEKLQRLNKRIFGLVWRVPLGELLKSGHEYVETELSTADVCACMEVSWEADGVGLVVGVQRIDGSGVIEVQAAVIGLPCACRDQKHNAGWELEGGVEGRNVDWVVSHEVVFKIFDGMGLREWCRAHKDCGILIKVRVAVADVDKDRDTDDDEDSDEDDDGDNDGKLDMPNEERHIVR